MERVFSGAIDIKDGDPQYVKSPSEIGTSKAQDEKAPPSEIIEVLNERFGTQFSEEDQLFFEQIKEKACILHIGTNLHFLNTWNFKVSRESSSRLCVVCV